MSQSSKQRIDEASQLTRKVVDGNIEAFGRFYEKFCPILRRLFANYGGHEVSVDDFIQEVFMRFWQQRKSFRGKSCLVTYLFAIARHTLKEQSRKSAEMVSIKMKARMEVAVDSRNGLSDPETELYLKELAAAVERVRGKLTRKQQQALEISQATDAVLHEVSQGLDCSREALRSRLKRARKRAWAFLAPVFIEAYSSA